MKRQVMSAALALCFAACATPETAAKPAEEKKAEPATTVTVTPAAPAKKFTLDTTKPMPPGLDEAAMNPNADPCTDFYEFACGGWMQKTEIPADRSINSRGFVSIADRNEANLHAILDDAAAGKLPAGTPFAKQLGDYYASCTDEKKLEASLPEVKKFIAANSNVKNATDLAKTLGTLHASGFHPLFDLGPTQDLKNSTEVIGMLDQSGLGLPDRDYYTEQDDRKKGIRENYVAYIEQMLTMAGAKAEDAKKDAATIMALETRLAKVSQTKVERRDPNKLYNRIDRKGLIEKAPDFKWDAYFTAVGAKDLKNINVNSVPYFAEVAAIAKDTKPDVLKPYIGWVILRASIPALPKSFQDAAFAYNAKNFTGAKEDRPRWKKCVAFTDGDLGEALGREFARRFFPEEAKQRTNAMVESLQASFESNLATLKWMDDATRTAALAKVKRMVGNNKIGYTNNWRDYTDLKTTRDSFFKNSTTANQFEVKRHLAKIGKPVDRTEWLMSPPTVNAYYEPQKNEIVFPAGILQAPFFSQEATDAVNFGSMGMVVGHEITHGFDDEGRQYDLDGNLKNWWSEAVSKDFVARAACVKGQYDNYVAIDDIKIKGDLTMGENIADLGGLKLAHSAMQTWYSGKGNADDAKKYRLSLSQQFFMGFAQSWCTKLRPENARLRAATDPHSPAFWRVNGPTANLDAFKAAFECTDTSKMIRAGANQCVVW